MGLKETLRRLWARVATPLDATGRSADIEAADRQDFNHEANLAALEKKLGYPFQDRRLLAKALLHRSHVHVTRQGREQSNERLEFLGDAVLGLVVNEALFRRFSDRSEGDLTKMKSLLVCGTRLSEVAGNLDLGIHVRMSRSEAATGGRQRSSILADTTEAIIGAVFLDGGLEAARQVIQKVVMAGAGRLLTKRSLRNYKSRLQELIQARYKSPPRYKVLNVEGPDHDRLFKVAVTFEGNILGTGEGSNKKTAEQKAACEALELLDRDPEQLESPSE